MPIVVIYASEYRLLRDGEPIHALTWRGTIPGVVITDAAGLNGVGTGTLHYDGAGRFAWRPPGASKIGGWNTLTPGVEGAVFGPRLDQFLRVVVHADYLPAAAQSADVLLLDRFSNGATAGDVTADNAAAGDIREYTITFQNTSPGNLAVYAWLTGDAIGGLYDVLGLLNGGQGASTPTLELSADGVNWSSPIGAAAKITLGLAAAGATETLHVRETIPTSASSAAKVTPLVAVGFQAIGVNKPLYTALVRGAYRIFNAAGYRFYRSQTGPPQPGDAPFATAASLPSTPAETFTDGTWYLSASYFNGVFDSGFLPIGDGGETYVRLDLAGGAATASPPKPIPHWRLEARPGGVARVIAFAGLDTSSLRADEWALGVTVDGSTPAAGSPTHTVPFVGSGLQVLEVDLPAAEDGAVVSVLLQTRRNDGTDAAPAWVYSEDATVQSITVDAAGPSAPLGGDRWPGLTEANR